MELLLINCRRWTQFYFNYHVEDKSLDEEIG